MPTRLMNPWVGTDRMKCSYSCNAFFLIACMGWAAALRSLPVKNIHYTKEAEGDRVPYLPGVGQVNGFSLFAGYVTVDESAGRALFYIFAESMGNPRDDPLILWLNGGPGCSSIGGGFMSELGPWFASPASDTLKENPYAWNKQANMLFLESPAFVGFSYSNTSDDRIVGDERTAADSVVFLKGFLEKFPHLVENDLYLSGESYAGHYVPNLAYAILKSNENSSKPRLNLQGFLVGNPWTDAPIDNAGTVDYWHAHALISDETYAGILDNCDFSDVGPLDHSPSLNHSGKEELCDHWCERVPAEMGPINIYQILADVCLTDPSVATGRFSSHAAAFLRHLVPHSSGVLVQKLKMAAGIRLADSLTHTDTARRSLQVEDPCIDNEVQAYLNRPDVQRALHVHALVNWSDCTDDITYSRDDLLSSMLPVYQSLIFSPGSANLRILIFSGDIDGMVPVVGTRRWVATLGLEVKTHWHPWLHDGQVAGYSVSYERGFTFATIRGAGHMAPWVQPSRSYQMFESFINNKRI
jgi:serine carboxypeptidase-like clade 2